jgi:hypothetical protein
MDISMKNKSWVVYGLRLSDCDEYRYVGKTTKSLYQRIYLHFWESSKDSPRLPVHKWIKSVGSENVSVDILKEIDNENDEELSLAEINEIGKCRSANHRLLNLTDGGEGTRGYRGTEKSRTAQSEKMSGKNNPRYGTKWTPELRKKIMSAVPDQSGSNSPRFGKKNSEEHRKKISENHHDVSGQNNPFYGKVHTKQTRKKMSEAWSKRSPEQIEKMIEKRKHTLSQRTHEELSEMAEKRRKPKRSNHTRYHTNMDVFNNDCKYCTERKSK